MDNKAHLDENNNHRDTILDSIADGVFTVDTKWRITSFNRAAERITGVMREKAIGKPCSSVFRSSICESGCALRQTMETGSALVNRTIDIINCKGKRIPISISTALLKNSDGDIIGGVETFRDLSAVETLRKELQGRYTFHDITSRSKQMLDILGVLPDIATSGSSILIEGASGTGKELVARAIHSLSPRKEGPFIAVNCGALPDALLESELFGYKQGAFTDAKKDKLGRFALAEGGTILLDEIGDISHAMQVRLLRVLQEKVYEPLGATKSVKSDVRVIAATNKNLDALVQDGSFRQDLYYRINILRIALPPLKQRQEDIPLLAQHFVQKFNALRGREVKGISDSASTCMMLYDFPGNVRELENAIEHAFVFCGDGMIEPYHLPEVMRSKACGVWSTETASGAKTLEDMERLFIAAALERNTWNRNNTAQELGIDRSTLRRKIQNLGIKPPADLK